MDRQTLRDWVHRYNAEGLAGLASRRGSGRPRQLTPEQKAELAGWVEAGPDLGSGRRGALAAQGPLPRRIEATFGVALHERTVGAFGVALHQRTVGKQLAALGFRRLSVRPQHPKSDPVAQDAFKKAFRQR